MWKEKPLTQPCSQDFILGGALKIQEEGGQEGGRRLAYAGLLLREQAHPPTHMAEAADELLSS